MSVDLDNLLDFVRFTDQIRQVKRAVIMSDDAYENDAEHMYQMGLMSMFIIDTNNLKLDKFKCASMALLHDVVEAYAGDTTAFAPSKDLKEQKIRESKAIKKLESDWPSFESMHELIHEYEELKTPESKFVYSLDKLTPEINNYLGGGEAWKKQRVSFDQVKNLKKGKIDKDPTINEYHQQILKLIEADPALFSNNKE